MTFSRLLIVVLAVAIVLVAFLRRERSVPREVTRVADSRSDSATSSGAKPPPGRDAVTSDVPPPRAPVAASPSDETVATPADLEKVRVLDEILQSKNDNDPRLDIVFRGLSPAAKRLLRDKYATLPSEKLNEKGTIVFLLGREVREPADVAFLGKVVHEPACLSLSDCQKARADEGDPSLDHAAGVTLAYPKLVAVKAMETYLKRRDRDPGLSPQAWDELKRAAQSPVPQVARLAQKILKESGG